MQNKYSIFFSTIIVIILTVVFVFFSRGYSTVGGEMLDSGFPLHYQSVTFQMPCYPSPCTTDSGRVEINYNSLIIDFIFWLVVSCLLLFSGYFIFKKFKK